MSEDGQSPAGVIGPNAILQFLPLLDRLGEPRALSLLLEKAGIPEVPDGSSMIPETQAARLHRQVRDDLPGLAPKLTERAGLATADYILAHRIPAPARAALKLLPACAAARVLSRAIAQHAWTFAGSGQFHVIDPWTFEVVGNPLIRHETSTTCLCHWHVGVFARLYQKLVARDCFCVETRCSAQGLGAVCRFDLGRMAANSEDRR